MARAKTDPNATAEAPATTDEPQPAPPDTGSETTAGAAEQADARPHEPDTVNDEPTLIARVLCAVSIGAERYAPNDVVDALPVSLFEQHADALDDHPDAVALALRDGGARKRYGGD